MKSNFKKCASAVKYLPSRGIPNPELFSEFGGRIGGLLYVPYKIGKLQIQGFSEPTTPNKIKQS